MITLYGINNCDRIKKTRTWLTDHGVEYKFHDFKKAGCPPALIKQFLEHFTYQELINTRGTTWRKLSEQTKNSLDLKSATVLMCEQASIIKRPLLRTANDWVLGYDEERLVQLVALDEQVQE